MPSYLKFSYLFLFLYLCALQVQSKSCIQATEADLDLVLAGQEKLEFFLEQCRWATGGSPHCEDVIRPNPRSTPFFECTFPKGTEKIFIHPDESTWENAFVAIRLIGEMEANGIGVKHIYNWWRPVPYNENVGGEPDRHPFGTSVDVLFTSRDDQVLAHEYLCEEQAKGLIKALGFYWVAERPSIHIGVKDSPEKVNWGRACDF